MPDDSHDYDSDAEYDAFHANNAPNDSARDYSANGAADQFTPVDRPESVIPLGHDRGVFFYLSRSAGQVFALTTGQHTKLFLMAMASVPHYWECSQFKSEKSGVRWDDAADFLMNECRRIGIYDPERVRGRGVWMDQDTPVFHNGDRLIINGQSHDLTIPGSPYVYESSRAMMRNYGDVIGGGVTIPLSNGDANKLIDICKQLSFEKGISATLLAGFIVIAPICGGLLWRPSIWIAGGSGAGKSWLKHNIIDVILGLIALQVQSKTSEAGIRQMLGSDARPVIFDEAEAEDKAAQFRMQGVLDLVRQSSSEGGADIIKGGADGRVKRFRIRSSFLFLSINPGLVHEADVNRITVLTLAAARKSEADFTAFAVQTTSTITPAYAAGLIARSVRLLPVIRANAEIFAQAVSDKLGSRRTGDQIGTLLAGAYSLHSDRLISPADAAAYVARQDWEDAVTPDEQKDEQRLLAHLMAHTVRYNPGNSTMRESSLGALVAAAADQDHQIPRDIARPVLLDHGMRFMPYVQGAEGQPNRPAGLAVATNHPALARALAETPWAKGWARALMRLTGAETLKTAVRFGVGNQSRATWLPLSTIDQQP